MSDAGIAKLESSRQMVRNAQYFVLTATLKDGNDILEVIPVKVGFRKVEIKDAQLLVNGQPVLIKGLKPP